MHRRLILIRHAKSSWDHPDLEDFERPLNARGRRDAPRMAEHLRASGLKPDRLLSSPALRAVSTARAFAAGLSMDLRDVALDSRIYEASAGELCAVVHSQPDEARTLMLFGHNPGISQFARWLCAESAVSDVPTCAVIELEFDIDRWSQLAPGQARLAGYHVPRTLD
jgi:phosphohistidine phosphatase